MRSPPFHSPQEHLNARIIRAERARVRATLAVLALATLGLAAVILSGTA